jgi:iron-binding CDGSH zinc finger protein
VRVDDAMADEIAAVVARCPSGALHVERLDGGVIEEPSEPTTIEPQPNGPLYVSAPVRILDANGVVIREDTRMALCRCGHSRSKPFCDGSHEPVDFRA